MLAALCGVSTCCRNQLLSMALVISPLFHHIQQQDGVVPCLESSQNRLWLSEPAPDSTGHKLSVVRGGFQI